MAEHWYQQDPYPEGPSFSLRDRSNSEASSRRRNHYGSQRMAPPSQSTSTGSGSRPKSKGRDTTYDEPRGFSNLDEATVPLPVESPDDGRRYRRQSQLEDTIRQNRTAQTGTAQTATRPTNKASLKQPLSRKERNQPQGEQELTEVAAPPPIQKSLDEEAAGGVGRQQFLEHAEGGEETSDETPPYREKPPKDEDKVEVPKFLTELYTVSYLIFFAILGTLARLGVQWITFYPGAPLATPVIWANFGGSLIMGFLAEDQCLFRDGAKMDSEKRRDKQRRHSKIANDLDDTAKGAATKRKKAIPLYVGLATGFCGSFTSFSSFARDFFLALSNNLPTPINHPYSDIIILTPTKTVARNGGYSFEAFIQVVIATLALSIGGLISGAQLAMFLDPFTPRIHGSFVVKYIDKLSVVLGFGCWLGAVFLAIFPPDRGSAAEETWRGEVLFALVFAPLGCLLRFYASMKLNGLVPAFPLGTFAVNMLGTAIEGMCFDLQHAGLGAMAKIGGGVVGCQVLQGVQDGFCGCLTTVSTWVAEINGLKRRHGWLYAFGSVVGALCLMLVIMGGVRWSIGYRTPVCNTGYTSKVHG